VLQGPGKTGPSQAKVETHTRREKRMWRQSGNVWAGIRRGCAVGVGREGKVPDDVALLL
jgi:hypothetical protein